MIPSVNFCPFEKNAGSYWLLLTSFFATLVKPLLSTSRSLKSTSCFIWCNSKYPQKELFLLFRHANYSRSHNAGWLYVMPECCPRILVSQQRQRSHGACSCPIRHHLTPTFYTVIKSALCPEVSNAPAISSSANVSPKYHPRWQNRGVEFSKYAKRRCWIASQTMLKVMYGVSCSCIVFLWVVFPTFCTLILFYGRFHISKKHDV